MRSPAPGGGYGFGFADVEGRNLAWSADSNDHKDTADVAGPAAQDRARRISTRRSSTRATRS